MATRVHSITQTVNGGEWSPRLDGRTDLAKFNKSCKTMLNYIVQPQGGASRRPGLRYVAGMKSDSAKGRLVPFQFSVSVAYVLEFGNQYIRFYKNGAQLGGPYEISTPYTTADLFDLQFAQSADVLYIVHRLYAPRKLQRFGDTDWLLQTIVFTTSPSVEYGKRPATTITPAATTGTGITFTAGAACFLASDVGRVLISGRSRATIVTFTDTTHVNADITVDFASTSAIASGSWYVNESPKTSLTPASAPVVGTTGINLTLAANGWQADATLTDVGKFVSINGGVFEITAVTTALVAVGTVRAALSAATASPSGSWSLDDSSFGASFGFPGAITFHEGRLFLASTNQQPDTFWGSVSGDYENFTSGANADDGLEFTPNSTQINTIEWLSSGKNLLIGTSGGEYRAYGQSDAPLTANNPPNLRNETSYGSKRIQAIKLGQLALFVQRAGRKVHEYTYEFQRDGFVAPDLTMLAEHLTVGGFTVLGYQQQPDTILWAVRNDGTLCGMTYLRDQDVVAWHRHITGRLQNVTDGVIESVAVIPHQDLDRDQVWVSVKRTINGATKRYVEYFDDKNGYYGATAARITDAGGIMSDCAYLYSGVATNTVTGVTHLIGETVKVVADGAVRNDAVVSPAGEVTVSGAAATLIEIGLHYGSKLIPQRPEVATPSGTSQGLRKRWASLNVRFKDTVGAYLNTDELQFRSASDSLDDPPPIFSGDKKVPNMGWDTDGYVTIEQRQPLPQTVTMLSGVLEVGDV